MTVRVLGVGAAAPELRLRAADVGAAWGRGGRGEVAVCAPDEDTLTLAWQAATVGGALCAGSTHAGVEPLAAGTDAISAGSARVALVVVSDALRPGPGTGFEARCGAGAAALVLAVDGPVTATIGARVTRTRPFLDRYRGDGEVDNRDMYDARLFREEIFLPVVRDVTETLAAFDVRAWSLPDPDGRLGAVLAREVSAPITPSSTIYGAIGDAGAAAALLGGIAALDAAGLVAIVGTGGGSTEGVIF